MRARLQETKHHQLISRFASPWQALYLFCRSISMITSFYYPYLLCVKETYHLVRKFSLQYQITLVVTLFSSLTPSPLWAIFTAFSEILGLIRLFFFSSCVRHPQNCLPPFLNIFDEQCLKRLLRVSRASFP